MVSTPLCADATAFGRVGEGVDEVVVDSTAEMTGLIDEVAGGSTGTVVGSTGTVAGGGVDTLGAEGSEPVTGAVMVEIVFATGVFTGSSGFANAVPEQARQSAETAGTRTVFRKAPANDRQDKNFLNCCDITATHQPRSGIPQYPTYYS